MRRRAPPRRPGPTEGRDEVLRKGAVLLASAGALLLAWGLRNHLVLGDVTGGVSKAAYLGWTVKPASTLFDHPIFTPGGVASFWHETMKTFWRGEFVWGLQATEQRLVLWQSLALLGLSVAFLAAISVTFDFDGCFYPSRAYPFMTSGRLAMGALIPFAALYVHGLDVVLPGRRAGLRWAVLVAIVVLMTISEVSLAHVAFQSPYNWFHLF